MGVAGLHPLMAQTGIHTQWKIQMEVSVPIMSRICVRIKMVTSGFQHMVTYSPAVYQGLRIPRGRGLQHITEQAPLKLETAGSLIMQSPPAISLQPGQNALALSMVFHAIAGIEIFPFKLSSSPSLLSQCMGG